MVKSLAPSSGCSSGLMMVAATAGGMPGYLVHIRVVIKESSGSQVPVSVSLSSANFFLDHQKVPFV